MIQKELNQENKEIMDKAYELYKEHGFEDGNDFVDWLDAEKQVGKQSRIKRNSRIKNLLYAIVGILSVIVVILLIMLFRYNNEVELSEKSLSSLKVIMLGANLADNEKVVVFGETYFDFGKSTLSQQAKTLLDNDVRIIKNNPQINIRMAGYTSAKGSEEVNQELSEDRANAVRAYLIEEGISAERITVIGYGRTRPAMYEVRPGDINSKEALANMRVLFEVVIK
jgi:outer membrane protein OmpA-like peptidoglycan-associated protein